MPPVTQTLLRHAPPGQVVRFLIVGAGNTLFAYGLFALLNYALSFWIHSDYVAAMTASAIGTFICITFSFVSHKLFVFRTQGNFLKEYLRSFVVYGSTAIASFVLLPVLMLILKQCEVRSEIVPYLAGGILTAGTVVVSFFGHRRFTFAQTHRADSDADVSGRASETNIHTSRQEST